MENPDQSAIIRPAEISNAATTAAREPADPASGISAIRHGRARRSISGNKSNEREKQELWRALRRVDLQTSP